MVIIPTNTRGVEPVQAKVLSTGTLAGDPGWQFITLDIGGAALVEVFMSPATAQRVILALTKALDEVVVPDGAVVEKAPASSTARIDGVARPGPPLQ